MGEEEKRSALLSRVLPVVRRPSGASVTITDLITLQSQSSH